MRPMNRIKPVGRTQDYRTYQIVSPLSTHWRPATCAEVDCPHYLKGWRIRVEGLLPQMLHAARTSGRKYTELNVAEGENWLVFEAGQACFRAAEHRVLLDKREVFLVRDGDFRGNPSGHVRKHTRAEHWVEDMAENLDKVAQKFQQG